MYFEAWAIILLVFVFAGGLIHQYFRGFRNGIDGTLTFLSDQNIIRITDDGQILSIQRNENVHHN